MPMSLSTASFPDDQQRAAPLVPAFVCGSSVVTPKSDGHSKSSYLIHESGVLGEAGGSGKCYYGHPTEGDLSDVVAIKVMHHGAELTSTEVKFAGKYLNGFCGQYTDDFGATHDCLVMDYLGAYSLRDYLIRFKQSTSEDFCNRLAIIYLVLNSLQKLHNEKCVHGDIKLSNFILSDNAVESDGKSVTVNLCDFAYSHDVSAKAVGAARGVSTIAYAAPELLNDESVQSSFASDVFSLTGVILSLLGGDGTDVSFEPRKDRFNVGNITEHLPSGSPELDSAAMRVRYMLKKMQSHKPEYRPSVFNIQQFFRHYLLLMLKQNHLVSEEALAKADCGAALVSVARSLLNKGRCFTIHDHIVHMNKCVGPRANGTFFPFRGVPHIRRKAADHPQWGRMPGGLKVFASGSRIIQRDQMSCQLIRELVRK